MDLLPIDQVEVALQAYRELQAELQRDSSPKEAPAPEIGLAVENETPATAPDRPDLQQVLEAIGPLPAGTIFLGLAEDGSPLLHDLFPPDEQRAAAGPLLVTGEARSGKTAFLQTLTASLDAGDDPGDVLFGVLTPRLAEWEAFEAHPSSLGIWPTRISSMARLLGQLCAWADSPHHHHAGVMLLIDGLDLLVEATPEIRRDLRYLLLYGPAGGIWPVATLDAAQAGRLRTWLDYFPSRIYGRVSNRPLAEFLTDDPAAALETLTPGVQYLLELPDGWLKFWLPVLNLERKQP
ncbi:MAG: ATP-binding protein [Anaerolineales bacterium]